MFEVGFDYVPILSFLFLTPNSVELQIDTIFECTVPARLC
jgi:hypothetical protein